MNRVLEKLLNPRKLLLVILSRVFVNMEDERYLKIWYFLMTKERLNLDNPKTFNEKLQWLKLYNIRSLYTKLVDKHEVKAWVKERIGEEYVIPTLGVWDSFDDINFDELPDKFVIKCTHDSGGYLICKDKSTFDVNAARKFFKRALKRRLYKTSREYVYKGVKPRIIAEPLLVDESGKELKDYKFFCFQGEPKFFFILSNRMSSKYNIDYFDMDMNRLPFGFTYTKISAPINYQKPQNFEKMKELSAVLSKNIPHVRVDFYNINGRIYFGEMTFYHSAGVAPVKPKKWERILGDWIELPKHKQSLD